MVSSPDYFRMRASHCRKMADVSTDPAVRHIHEELAERYARQAEEAKTAHPSTPERIGEGGVAARRELQTRLP